MGPKLSTSNSVISSARTVASSSSNNKMFNTYANDPRDDCGSDRIGPNGIMRLLDDLKLDPSDRKVLILACKLKAKTQCEFSYDEWKSGIADLKVNSVSSLRSKLNELDKKLSEPAAFREVYNFSFNYGKPVSQRNMDLPTAIIYWGILFKDSFPLLGLWEDFVQKEHGVGISLDEWSSLADFNFMVKNDIHNFVDDGAWPILIDEFVAYAQKKGDKIQYA